MTANPTARKRPTKPAPIITQRLSLLAEATARLAKAERLVASWLKRADKTAHRPKPNAFCDSWTLGVRAGETHAFRRCADQLSRILKP